MGSHSPAELPAVSASAKALSDSAPALCRMAAEKGLSSGRILSARPSAPDSAAALVLALHHAHQACQISTASLCGCVGGWDQCGDDCVVRLGLCCEASVPQGQHVFSCSCGASWLSISIIAPPTDWC